MKKLRRMAVVLAVLIVAGALFTAGIGNRAVAGTGGEKDVTLKAGGPDPADTPLSKSHQERVRWYNTDDRGHTITFTDWPFAEAPEAISVKAGEKSHWYTVYKEQPNGKYTYSVDPPMKTAAQGGTPPDGPSVSVGD